MGQAVPLLTAGPFGGLDTSSSAYYIADEKAFAKLNIIPIRKRYGYYTIQGRTVATANPFQSKVTGMTKFLRKGLSTQYIAFTQNTGLGQLQSVALGGSPTTLTLPAGVTLTAGKQMSYAESLGYVFLSDGTNTPLSIDQSLVVRRWGIVAPSSALTASATGSGNLSSSYSYVYTYVSVQNGITIESSPSPFSPFVSYSAQQASLTGITVSSDPQVTARNIYRVGGALLQYTLVATINDNTTTTYTDNLADASVTGQVLILHQDAPPAFQFVNRHKGRVWGYGTSANPTYLYFSNYLEPWGFDTTNQIIPIDFDIEAETAAGIASVGGILVAFTNRSAWAVYGSSTADFNGQPLFNIGCIAPLSIAVGYGQAFWLSYEGVYSFDGAKLQYRSADIHNTLRGLSLSDLSAAVGAIWDNCYILSFPTLNMTYAYELDTQDWHPISWSADNMVYDPENNYEVTATEVGSGTVVSWFNADTDLGGSITSSYTTKISDSGDSSATKLYRYATVLAPIQNSGQTMTLSVFANPGLGQSSFSQAINIGQPPINHVISLPATLQGDQVQLQVTVVSSAATEIEQIRLYGWAVRKFGITG